MTFPARLVSLSRPVVAALVALAAAFACASGAGASTYSLNASNSSQSTNVTADGAPLDETFTFEIGTFDPGLTPTPFNALDWLDHWVPLTDSNGLPLAGASVTYDNSELGPPFPLGSRANNFAINVELTHNLFPFVSGGTVYIWGFDRRQGGGLVEWILIRHPLWKWPLVTPEGNPQVLTFEVSDPDTLAVLGQVNSGGVEMRTGTVTLSTIPFTGFDAWLFDYFSEAELNDPALEETLWGFTADGDGDGIPNALEFISGTSPIDDTDLEVSEVSRPSANVVTFSFIRLKNTGNVIAGAEWSSDLGDWSGTGVTETVVEDLGNRERVEASVTVPSGTFRVFMRLAATRQTGSG